MFSASPPTTDMRWLHRNDRLVPEQQRHGEAKDPCGGLEFDLGVCRNVWLVDHAAIVAATPGSEKAAYRSGNPAVAGGVSLRGPTLPRLGDKLVGDQLCPRLQRRQTHTPSKSEYRATCTSARIALHAGAIPHQPGIAAHCTSRFSSSSPGEPGLVQVTLRASRSAKTGARAPRFSARSRHRRGRGGRSGRRRVIAVKLPSQRFKSNEMPVAPDRVCPIRNSPVSSGVTPDGGS